MPFKHVAFFFLDFTGTSGVCVSLSGRLIFLDYICNYQFIDYVYLLFIFYIYVLYVLQKLDHISRWPAFLIIRIKWQKWPAGEGP